MIYNNQKVPMPQISIIIASYNSESTIRYALESVKKQSFQNWECIVIDGASKDKTVSIVEEFEMSDFRFSHLSEPDSGIYDAFNKGWRLAKGEWVYYLGSDDFLTQESFTSLIKASNNDVEVISGDVWIKKIDGTIKANLSDGFAGCHQGKIVRRSVLEKMNGFDQRYRILADLDLMIRMQNAGVKIVNVRSFVAYFLMDGKSQSIRGEWKRYKERVQIYKENKVSMCPELTCAIKHLRIALSVLYRSIRKTFM